MEVLGTVSSIKSQENEEIIFRLKLFTDEKFITCVYNGFFPIKEKDNIKGIVKEIDKKFYFEDLPLATPPVNIDYLKDCIFRALKRKGIYTKKSLMIVEELKKQFNNDIKEIYKNLHQASCDNNFNINIGCISFEETDIFLRWWKRNIVKRQLYLWNLYDSEIKSSGLLEYELNEKLKINALKINSLNIDKALQLERLFGRNHDDKEIKVAQIYRYILGAQNKGWYAFPLNYLMRAFPHLPLYRKKLEEIYEIIFEEELVYSKENYEREEFISDKIVDLVRRGDEEKLNSKIRPEILVEDDIVLTREQKEALDGLLENHISVVTGGAGCGKTTLIKKLVKNLKARGEKFIITSFTGKAVLRLKETLPEDCEKYCFTLSRIIHIFKTKKSSINFTSLIIDEASMVSCDLIYQFFNFFQHYYKIYLFGDCNQLPPIGCGNFFQEVIKSKIVPVFRLTINKRIVNKEENSMILNNANALISDQRNKEEIFNFNNGGGFYLIEGGIEYCKKIIKALKKQKIEDNDITILTPFNKNITELIKCHQETYLGNKYFEYKGQKYYIGDRVMQTKNVYQEENEIMNGEEGIIKEINKEGIKVKFSEKKIINYIWDNDMNLVDETDENSYEDDFTTGDLRHSFCKTVHKSQGSEYNYVIFYIPKNSSDFININLLYTAITRTKKTIWIVADKETLDNATRRVLPEKYEKLYKRIYTKYNNA